MAKQTLRAKVINRLKRFQAARRPDRLVRLIWRRGQPDQQGLAVIDGVVHQLLTWLENTRYLQDRIHESRTPTLRLQYFMVSIKEEKFRKYFRLSRSAFTSLLRLIQAHDFAEFRSTEGKREKAVVELHLLVLLHFLGINGNACSLTHLADFFWLGMGTVKDYLDRTVNAVRQLKASIITWPSPHERVQIARGIGQRSVFKNCVGYLDGTIFPFECKPQIQAAEDYFSRKSCYGLNAQIVCDDECRVRYIYCGWPASVHDNRAWQHTVVHKNCSSYFSTKEYILVDSAYKPSEFVIPAFKKGRCTAMEPGKAYFNTALAAVRIKSEHCLGRLKGRFQQLKRIRAELKDKETKKRILAVIDVACILHNLAIDDMIPPAWIDTEDEPESYEEDSDDDNFDDSSRREQLFEYVLETSPF